MKHAIIKSPALRCWCEINLNHLAYNLKQIRQKIGSKRALWCSVKANAYGHGLIPIAKFIESQKLASGLLCAHWKEAYELRLHKIRLPILILSGFLKEELEIIFKLNAAITLSSMEEFKMVEKEAKRLRASIGVHIKLDTGMTRLGAYSDEFKKMVQYAFHSPMLRLEGVYTHFANSDSNRKFTHSQWEQLETFKKELPAQIPFHACNSGGIFLAPYAHANGVRCGIAMYGIDPMISNLKNQNILRPVLTWKTRVLFVKEVPPKTPISYGSNYVTKRKTMVATLAVGYGDGLLRAISKKGFVLIHGKPCPILGNITMDQMMVDVTSLRGVQKGTEAILIGNEKRKNISADLMAQWADTISYEILTLISARVDRIYYYSKKRK